MAKNFPYFKFTVSEWMTGDIVFESFEVQGLFINICALYWQRDGVLTVDDINKRYKKPDLLTELLNGFLLVNNGVVSVKFLDEQLIEANHISKINSENGSKGGRPKKTENKPTALNPLTEQKAKKSKEEQEEEIEQEKKEIKILNKSVFSFDEFWSLYPKKSGKEPCIKKYEKLSETDRQNIKETLADFKAFKPFKDYTHPNPLTYLNQKRWNDEIKNNQSITITSIKDERISAITKGIRENSNGRI